MADGVRADHQVGLTATLGQRGLVRRYERSSRKNWYESVTRLEFVTVTRIDVDDELNRAHVYYDSLSGPEADEEIIEALGEHRVRIQSSIGRQIRAKKTPILQFAPDDVIRAAERIDEILRADSRSDEAGVGE